MPASSRRKGLLGEREVARIWQAAGFEVRGLEGLGDHLVLRRMERMIDVYTVYLRDEDGNRIDSSSGLDPATAREISDAFLDRLGVCPE
jgi:hypothetical protein